MKIDITGFRAMSPKTGAKFLEPSQATLARNCRLYNGELRPLRDNLFTWTPTKTGTIQSLHLFARQYWFHWADDVDAVRTMVPNDTTERTFWTGDGYPKQTEAGMATSGGGTNYPNNHYALGMPAPANTPIASPPAADPETENESRAYVYTYVSAWGEEGPPSPPTALFTCDVDAEVGLSNLSGAPTGPYNVLSKRIYRLSTGTDDTEFFFVGEIPVAQTTFTDTVPGSQLKEVLPSEDWDAPPETLQGLLALPNGAHCGFVGKDLYLTPPYVPYAWPRDYMVSSEYPIVGLGAFDTNIVVLTEGHPYIATGVDPSAVALSKIEVAQACVSKRSIASLGASGVAYASPDGLVVIGAAGFEMASEPYMTREEWQAYKPESILGAIHDGKYIGFYEVGANTKGGFIFDRAEGFSELGFHATAAFSDLLTDTLYLVVDGEIVAFDSASDLLEYRWKSKLFQVPPVSFAAARVLAADYEDLTVSIYADGALRHTQAVTSPDSFRLPPGARARVWQIDLEGTSAVQGVTMSTTIAEMHA